MRKVAIVGTGTLPWRSRYDDKTARGLAVEAIQAALHDAKLPKTSIDAVIYSIFSETVLRQQIPTQPLQDSIGFEYKKTLRVEADSATEMYALYAAFAEVASGMSDVVLLLGIQKGQDFYCSETNSRGDGFVRGSSQAMDTIFMLPVCAGAPAYLTVTDWLPHIHKYGGPTPEQVAKFSVMCHKNALANPDAQLKIDIGVEDVLNSRIIAWPTTMLHCCLYSESAAALILASEESAKEICDNPIWITGISVSSFPSNRLTKETLGRLIGVNIAGKRAYEMADIREPSNELDILEINDLISSIGILACEELGLCNIGEGGMLVDEGVFEKDGRLPVNPSGGRVACGHLAGVSGIYSAAQVVHQLQERAGETQVRIHSGKGLVEVVDGYGGFAGVAIFER